MPPEPRARLGWPGARRSALAFAAGAVAATGQAPLALWWLALAGFAALVWLVARQAGARGAGWLGLFGGAGHFAVALSWIVEPFLIEPEVYGWMAPFALVGLAFGLALFWAAAAASARLWPARGMGFALTLTAAEFARGHVLTGFPWALPGHIWLATPVEQLAGQFGAYGLTLLTLSVAALLAGLAGKSPWRVAGALLGAGLIAGGWAFGLSALAQPQPAPPGLTLRLVQPNAAQVMKWDPDLAATHLDRLLSYTSVSPTPDLVIWPETALPYLLDRHPELAGVIGLAGDGAPVAIGMQRVEGERAWNSLAIISPDGAIGPVYDKHHLVPFGEYVPLGDLAYRLFGLRAFAAQAGEGYSAGPGAQVLDLGRLGNVLPLICYEAVFPQDVAAATQRPDWILQITNDAWFGTLSGPFQHAELARLRAIEQGLPVVRVANTGVTAVYDGRGRVTAALPFGQASYLDASLPPPLPAPPYARLGEGPALLLWAVLALGLWLGGAARSRMRRQKAALP